MTLCSQCGSPLAEATAPPPKFEPPPPPDGATTTGEPVDLTSPPARPPAATAREQPEPTQASIQRQAPKAVAVLAALVAAGLIACLIAEGGGPGNFLRFWRSASRDTADALPRPQRQAPAVPQPPVRPMSPPSAPARPMPGGPQQPNANRGPGGYTALHMAAVEGDVEKVRRLLERGADVNARDDSGWTPLHMAVFNRRMEAALVLLNWGADVNARDHWGCTPWVRARQARDRPMVQMLEAHGGRE